MPDYEAVIGLEVHVQLSTKSKLFCSCPNTFGQAPNTNTCEVCAGMPGALPRVNAQAVHYATLVGLATHCHINQSSVFARKNYFYPDLPSGYQISQFDLPICEHGWLEIETQNGPKKIGITRIHMENDAGKNIHSAAENRSFCDLNRAGTPLVEVVTEPDMRSSEEVVAFLKELYGIVTYLDVCDGNMEEGNFRCDANVSVRPVGQKEFGTRCEIKNLNSFRFLQEAIDYEVRRQIELIEDGGKVVQATRLYDPDKGETRQMRTKEDSMDYRYFPDPDLLPLEISDEWIERVRGEMPELPHQLCERLQSEFGLPQYDASMLTASRDIADYYVALAAKVSDRKMAANWVMGELSAAVNGVEGMTFGKAPVTPEILAAILGRILDNTVNQKGAKQIFAAVWEGEGTDVDALIESKGLKQISDTGALEGIIDEVLAANQKSVDEFRAGKQKAFNALVGQCMKATRGKANPAQVNELLRKKLGA